MAKKLQQSLLASFIPGFAVGKIAAAVSGGADSVAMLVLLCHYCRIKKLELCVFHVDHSLRKSSEREAEWVADLSARLGLKFYQRKAMPADMSGNEKSGSEAWARRFRYSALAEMLKESGAQCVATGHTANDQAETIMMRLMRGCSLQGIGGIRARTVRHREPAGLKLWRPMLKISRDRLEEFLKEIGQDWCEDESNSTSRYLRNRVRHLILPEIEKQGSGFAANLSSLAEDISKLQRYLKKRADNYLKKNSEPEKLLLKKIDSGILRCEIIRGWLIEQGLATIVSRALIDRIDNLWKCRARGRKVDYRKLAFVRKNDSICLEKI